MRTLEARIDPEKQTTLKEAIEMMTVIDILLVTAIALMAWSMQFSGGQTDLAGLRTQSQSQTEDALTIVRAIRGSNRDDLQDRRLKGYREAVSQAQERKEVDDRTIDQAISDLDQMNQGRERTVTMIQQQQDYTAAIEQLVGQLRAFVNEIHDSFTNHARKTRTESIELENRIRELDKEISSTSQQLEDLAVQTGAYHR